MTAAQIKEKLRNGENLMGTMVTVFQNPDLVVMLKECGFDYVIIDCEHGYFEYGEVARLLGRAKACGLPALVRIAEARRELILKYMEMGADGLLLPDIRSREQAELLVKYSKYAPLGDRGVSFTRAHTGYRKVQGRTYMDQANADTILMCQFESWKSVEEVENIMGVEGIDVAFVGPNDLSQDLGILGDYENEKMKEAYARILAGARKQGKYAGIHFGRKEFLPERIEMGYQMNLCGNDVSFLMAGARAVL